MATTAQRPSGVHSASQVLHCSGSLALVAVHFPRRPAPFKLHQKVCKGHGVRLVKLLGRGMLSSVYLAENLNDVNSEGISKKVAMKIFEWQLAVGDCQRITYARLLKLYQEIPSHPNILPIRAHFSEGEAEYLMMDWHSLGSLACVVRPEQGALSRGLTEDAARDIFLQICSGLQYLHSQGLSHGHLTCENVVITKDYQVQLMDYGHVAAACNASTLSETQMMYTAPELLQQKPYDEFAGDVWSLGVVMFTILHGGVPFTLSDVKEVSLGRNLPRLPLRASISYICKQFLRRILTYSPMFRPTLDDLLRDPWVTEENDPLVENLLGKEHLAKCKREMMIRRRLRDLAGPTTRSPDILFDIFHTVGVETMVDQPVRRHAEQLDPTQDRVQSLPSYVSGTNIPILGTTRPTPAHPRGKLVIGPPRPKTWRQAYEAMLCGNCRWRQRTRSIELPKLFPLSDNYGVQKIMAPRMLAMMKSEKPETENLALVRTDPSCGHPHQASPNMADAQGRDWGPAMAKAEKTRKDFMEYYGGQVPMTCTEFPLPPGTVVPPPQKTRNQ